MLRPPPEPPRSEDDEAELGEPLLRLINALARLHAKEDYAAAVRERLHKVVAGGKKKRDRQDK